MTSKLKASPSSLLCYLHVSLFFLLTGLNQVLLLEATTSNTGNGLSKSNGIAMKDAVLNDIKSTYSEDYSDMPTDLDYRNNNAWQFLKGLSSSPTFVKDYWHQKPLLLRAKDLTNAKTGGWIPGIFTIEKDLKLVGNSYISGSRTADVLRQKGTKPDSTWSFSPLKADQTKPTTWKEVEEALKGGTIYFNTAGSLWPTLGSLCLMTNAAFGLPANVNIYITPPATEVSVPLHTDRQDVIVFQTAGAKRWRVYPPPPRKKGVDPLNRGKSGDVLEFDEYKQSETDEQTEALLDVVLKEGDVLYVPTGFPHTTDTITVVPDNDDNDDNDDESNKETKDLSSNVFSETSIHLTMGLDTHVWGLTYAHLRWSLLQRCGKAYDLNISNDELYWRAMETIPVGFLGKGEKWKSQDNNDADTSDFYEKVEAELRKLMIQLEPSRWKIDDSSSSDQENNHEKEELPDSTQFQQVIAYMLESHLKPLFKVQDEMFRNVDPRDENTIVKAYHGTQKQNVIMENFGKFSKNKAMEDGFKKVRESREVKLNGSTK